jgi:hypothetical protein
MKTLTITAPDEIFDQTVTALCALGGYSDGDRLEFAKDQLILLLGDKVREYARQQIRHAGQETIQATIQVAYAEIAKTRETIIVEIGSI